MKKALKNLQLSVNSSVITKALVLDLELLTMKMQI